MDKNYNVDDILAEVRSKKQSQPNVPNKNKDQTVRKTSAVPPKSEPPNRQEEPTGVKESPFANRIKQHVNSEQEDDNGEHYFEKLKNKSLQSNKTEIPPKENLFTNRLKNNEEKYKEEPKQEPIKKTDDFERFVKQKLDPISETISNTAEDVFRNVKRSFYADEETRTDIPKSQSAMTEEKAAGNEKGNTLPNKTPSKETLAFNPKELQMNFGMEDFDYAEEEKAAKGTTSKKKPREATIDDYTSVADKPSIIADFKSIKIALNVRLIITFILMLCSIYLSCSVLSTKIPLPEIIWPETQPKMFLVAHTVILIISMLVCSNIVGSGLVSLFRMRGDSDTLLALASIACVGQGIIYIMHPDAFLLRNTNLFLSVVIIGFLFNLLGKIMLSNRVARNFKLIAYEGDKKGMGLITENVLLSDLTRYTELENYDIAYGQSVNHLSDFLELSYEEDQGDIIYKFLSPICFAGAVALAIASYFTCGKDICSALATLAGVLTVCSAFTTTIIINMPMDRLSAKLTKIGAMVSGYEAVEACYDLEGVIVSAGDLFAPEQLVLHGIKTFDESRIDTVLIDAASVVCSRESTLSEVFSQILDGNLKLLRKVSGVQYFDKMGLVAEVEGNEVLIGTRELMSNYGITPPKAEFEAKFTDSEKDVVYLAHSGTLCAMLIVSYGATEDTIGLLDGFSHDGMHLFICTEDPNITPEKVEQILGYPKENAHIVSAKSQKLYDNLCSEEKKLPAKVGFIGTGNNSLLRCISGALAVKKIINLGLILQIFFVVLGYGIIALLTLQGKISNLGFFHILLYQSFATVVSLVVSNMKKI